MLIPYVRAYIALSFMPRCLILLAKRQCVESIYVKTTGAACVSEELCR